MTRRSNGPPLALLARAAEFEMHVSALGRKIVWQVFDCLKRDLWAIAWEVILKYGNS